MERQCIVFINSSKVGLVSWSVFNSADELIENPIMLTQTTAKNTYYGILVPYGGYFEYTTDSTHSSSIYTEYFSGSVSTFPVSYTAHAKIVCNVRISITSENEQTNDITAPA